MNKLIINLIHIKSTRLHPDGFQTRTPALVVDGTPQWTPALVKRFPQTHAALPLHFHSCWPHDTEFRRVACGQELIIDLFFYFTEMWARTHLPPPPITHLNQSPVGSLYTVHPSYAYLILCRTFGTYSADYTGLEAFGYKNSIPVASHLLFVMFPENMNCVSFHTLHSTSQGDRSYTFFPHYIKKSFRICHHYPIPRTPCSFLQWVDVCSSNV